MFTGVRDYIHIMDLASGHVKALIYQKTKNPVGFQVINLGSGKGHSVLEVIHAYEKASGKKIPYKLVERRAGDIAASYADASLAKKLLDWVAVKNIDDMCKWFFINLYCNLVMNMHFSGADTWRWQQKNPNGFSN